MNKEEKTFEEALKELEEIVNKLEEGDVPLEKAINYYQEGMELSKICNAKLTDVEKQMEKIVDEEGNTEPFLIQEDQ